MMRWIAVLVASAVAVAIVVAVVRAPRLTCTSLERVQCVTAASAILDQARPGPSIVAIGLVGYRGCFPGPVYCPLIPHETLGPLNALAGVEYADGSRAAFELSGLDSGGRLSASPMQEDLVDYTLRLVFPRQ